MQCDLNGNLWSDLYLMFACILYCLVCCRSYLAYRGDDFDRSAKDCLLGAASIVQECVLQQPNGHVALWAHWSLSAALVGLIRNLEITRQLYWRDFHYPRGLVPCVVCFPCRCCCVSDRTECLSPRPVCRCSAASSRAAS